MNRADVPGLDKEIHHPTRLTVAAFLSGCAEAEFGAVRDYCGVTDSVLSKTVAALEKAGYVSVRKGYLGKRPRTWVALTLNGRQALATHLAALEALAEASRKAGASGTAHGGAGHDGEHGKS
ncbi:transcriptional regulator [Streptomyces sp. NPDC096176]|uniref:transcriptional regulator n=1 Tax=Streptomyces sp. NPDC096176 TaxID=3366079 RepID=UPI0038199F20